MNISVIIPVYNAEKYITQAVQSAEILPEVKEIILIEDQSPDNALEVCKALAKQYDKVKLFQHADQQNHGAGASRNLGIEKATQEFIAFLDADDYYLPNRFEAEKEFFKNPEIEGVYGALGVTYYSDKAKEQYYTIYGDKLDTVYQPWPPEEVFPGFLYLRGSFGLIHLDTLTLRRKSLQKMNANFNEDLKLHQDIEFIIRVSYYLKLYPGIIDKAIAMRGIHESNRITQFDTHKINRASTQLKLWKSLYDWAKKEPTLDDYYKKHIARMYRSFSIAEASFPKNYGLFIKELFQDYKAIRNGILNINYRKKLFGI